MDVARDEKGNACRLIEALEEGSGFNSEDSSIIHSPFLGNGNIRIRGRRPACHSWNSDTDLPELTQPAEEEHEWTVGQTRFSSFGGSALELRWEALSMCSWQVTRKHQEAVQILTNVSGAARAGRLTCILGPSGSGKTTLLNVLAGRQSGGQRHRIRITGQVWISGQRVDPRLVRSRIAYVMQKDEMFATSTPTEVPLVFVQSLMTLGLCYVVMSLNGNFWALLWTIVLLSVCSVSVALAISCAVRQPRETGAVGPLVFVPQMLFSGVFIPVSHMPVYLRWMQYFSFLQYAIKILGVVEFKNVPHKELVLDAQDILEDSVPVYVGFLVMMVLIFSITGIQMLRNKATHLF